MIKPPKLNIGDTIATISPAWGCAGDEDVRWKYELGVRRLEELGLHVVAAPNSLKGASYLEQHPQKRAEDVMWAFENSAVKAIIANIGGNDSHKLLPYLHPTLWSRSRIGYRESTTFHIRKRSGKFAIIKCPTDRNCRLGLYFVDEVLTNYIFL